MRLLAKLSAGEGAQFTKMISCNNAMQVMIDCMAFQLSVHKG